MALRSDPRLAGRRVLLTGATGFIGRRLLAALEASGAAVTVLPGRAAAPPSGGIRGIVARARPEHVFHAAAETRMDASVEEYRRSNVALTEELVDALAGSGAPVRLVHVGTCGEYGRGPLPLHEDGTYEPTDDYSWSKLAATRIVMERASETLQATVARPFLTFGPGQRAPRLVPELCEAAVTGRTLELTAGDQERDFVFVDDVVRSLLDLALCPEARGRIVNVGTGVPTTVRQMVAKVCEVAGIAAGASPFRFGVLPYRDGEPFHFCADVTRLVTLTGRRPDTPLHASLAETLDWHRQRRGMRPAEASSPGEARS